MNPLLNNFSTPFETAPFDQIEVAHILPALKHFIEASKAEVQAIEENIAAPDFENTIVALEKVGERLGIVSAILFNLNAAETNEEIQKTTREASPLLTEFRNDILLNAGLFARIEQVFQMRDQLDLDEEQQTLLEKKYKNFARNGARLEDDKKSQLRELDKQLAQLSLAFGENVLADTNAYQMIIENEADLVGLPDSIKEAAAYEAKERGQKGKWVFTLNYPSYIPFMTYAQNRALRKEIFLAFSKRGALKNDHDNRENILKIVKLRQERAELLGYATHADFVLEERMANHPQVVQKFLDELLQYALPAAREEMDEIRNYAQQLDGIEAIERWDFAYYSEKLKKEKYAIDDELLKPYFQLEKVIDGVFTVAQKLFGLHFQKNETIPVYHPEVEAYEVNDKNGNHLAVLYADFFPRKGKRAGAWMTSYRGQKLQEGQNIRPHISIVCNFTKSTPEKPSLLTLNEVLTLFHEFGHALHGMLAQGKYESLTGTNVYWDFVELPSQIMENWVYEKETLDLFARHYESNEAISQDLIQRIKDSANYLEGYQTVRQISFAKLDMAWHSRNPSDIQDVDAFEKSVMESFSLFPEVAGTLMSTAFSHIFQGGYSSGYYSYKWAEVLDADAFELFKEKGIFDPEVAEAFQKNILSRGGSEHPQKLYKQFRGGDPDPKALLRRTGLLK